MLFGIFCIYGTCSVEADRFMLFHSHLLVRIYLILQGIVPANIRHISFEISFKNGTYLAKIEINAYICKRKTLLSLLNKQTSGLLFFMHLWQRKNSSVAYKLNPICYLFPT